ncbi:unnamed protein product [Dimorphilus gyrociliatus]|uniref:Complex III assembly factor LYRM7 n=1 Tax=Dimorphilus gyrociliatus TaxID=2664684 RepID=A0A7I8VX90_9ANNE|nr:unnamed protein product [Dimorphilus gyrociliatus]
MSTTRQLVLSCFKNLHRACGQVFGNDYKALIEARKKVNEEFRKNLQLNNEDEIKEKIQFGDDACEFLKTMVIQAEGDGKNSFKLNITKDTTMLENVSYDPEAVDKAYENKKKQRKTKK